MASNIGDKQWYIVTTYSMHEQKTADNLRKRIQTMNMEDYILRVLVAEQEVPVMDKETGLPATEKDKKTGEIKPKVKLKNLYPGYLFIEMIMTDESWYIVRNTPGVTGIVGSSGGGQKPAPVTRKEIEPVLKRMGEPIDKSWLEGYDVGDAVRIIRGTFEGTEGKISSIDKDTGACRIETLFFGRPTPVDVDFSEIEKI
jgi:transcription termination/antitermination protein NusG